MPTEPLETVLNRDLSRVAFHEIILIASPLLRELVNYATNAYARCVSSSNKRENEDVALFVLYLHTIEMVDGVEILISQSCPTPAIPLVRSAFEAQLAMEYILETDYVQRSLAWLAGYAHERISGYERLDPSTQKGKQFQSGKEKDAVAQGITLPAPQYIQHAIARLQNLLSSPQFQPVEAERKKAKSTKWHQLFDGPRSLETLAGHLNHGAVYDFLYRSWSLTTHASDVSRFIQRQESPDPITRLIRDGTDIPNTAHMAASIMLATTRLLLAKFRPDEDLNSWYLREVRGKYFKLL